MTDENTMPDEIYVSRGKHSIGPHIARLGESKCEQTKYIRASRHDEALRVIAECKTALECWKLFMPINEGDTLYSGHPKVMTEKALQAIDDFEQGAALATSK